MAQFPKDFIWGTACASFQCEGAWDADGKGPNIWDDFCHRGGRVKNDENGDVACDSYHRAGEDVALMCSLGVRAHRFSLDWARIFPDGGGDVNPKGFRYYDELVDGMLESGIEPWITLYHWDLPSALQREGGWLNRRTVDAFARYAEAVGRHFDGRVAHYMPVNEPQCAGILGYGAGEHAPGWQLDDAAVAQVMHNLTLAHAVANRELRAASAHALQIGTVTCGRLCYPLEHSAEGERAACAATFNLNHADVRGWGFNHNIFMDTICFQQYDETAPDFLKRFADAIPAADWTLYEKPDFMGLNIYNGTAVDAAGNEAKLPAGHPHTDMGWPVTPEVMYYGPRHIYARYGLPLVITENGMASNDRLYRDGRVHDVDRIDFLASYLEALRRSMDSGVDLRGYFHWSLLDNFEWAEGYAKRFGLIYVDYECLKRTPKDSAAWYARVARTGIVE